MREAHPFRAADRRQPAAPGVWGHCPNPSHDRFLENSMLFSKPRSFPGKHDRGFEFLTGFLKSRPFPRKNDRGFPIRILRLPTYCIHWLSAKETKKAADDADTPASSAAFFLTFIFSLPGRVQA
jgi:hypothetical protein